MNFIQTTILVCFLACNTLALVNDDIRNNISFMYYYGRDIDSYTSIPYDEGLSIITQPTFDASACTIFFYPGFNEKPALTNAEYCPKIVVSELLPHTTCNVIVIDFSSLVNNTGAGSSFEQISMGVAYWTAFLNSYKIGEQLAIFFTKFVNACNCLDMSFTGKNFNNVNINKFLKMTGLEPAGPLFILDHLEKSDAIFVSALHTDAGLYGTVYKSATADFWPNNGKSIQPGCSLATASNCSHYQVCYYYANSVRDTSIYQSQRCDTGYYEWKLGLCNSNPSYANMGYNVQNTAFGDYYLDT